MNINFIEPYVAAVKFKFGDRITILFTVRSTYSSIAPLI